MSFIELFLLAIGLSMDAFAVAICIGLTMTCPILKKSLLVGLYFGVFQAVMPLIGYVTASQFADMITSYDHWIAFALLCFLGGKMIAGSFKKEEFSDRKSTIKKSNINACQDEIKTENQEASLKPAQMLPLAVATSIDALAVGVSFAFLRVNILPAASFIGITTLVISMAGVQIGKVFGTRFKSKAELAGGLILVLIGFKILFEH
jgi:putative Mn2+ efflux pump MntP